MAARHQIGDQAGLRHDCHIGGAAGLGVDADLALMRLGGGIDDLGPGGGAELIQHGLEQPLILAPPRAKDRQPLAPQVVG